MKYHIKPYLKETGFNLSSLAKKLGMSFQKFDHHIKLKDDLSLNLARSISEILHIGLEEFITKVEVGNNINYKK